MSALVSTLVFSEEKDIDCLNEYFDQCEDYRIAVDEWKYFNSSHGPSEYPDSRQRYINEKYPNKDAVFPVNLIKEICELLHDSTEKQIITLFQNFGEDDVLRIKLDTLDYIYQEILQNINCDRLFNSPCLTQWVYAKINNIVVGGVFLYFQHDLIIPIIKNNPKIIKIVGSDGIEESFDVSGKKYTRMQGIGSSFSLIIAKTISKNHNLPSLNSLLLPKIISLSKQLGSHMILVCPICRQGELLLKHGFKMVTDTIHYADISWTSQCYPGISFDPEDSIIANKTYIYIL
jgi:hypothetical protein